MGSKRKSAHQIFQTIKNFNPDASCLVDLFCGGFAIGEYFLEKGWSVIANDKNKHVVALLDQVINKGLDERKCLEWVSRERFTDIHINQENYEDWYIGYVQCVWSFGNKQTSYIFGKDVESTKLAGHNLVVNQDASGVIDLIPQKYIDGILKQDNWHKRRSALQKVSKLLQNRTLELQQLERLERLQRLQQLQQLQQLERLQQLQQLERLELYSKDYNEVPIPLDAVIYCDPPYQGTAKYKEGDFKHDEFWQWARYASKKNKIYISEYQAPEDFEPLLSFEQKSTLQGGSQQHNLQPLERLFVPKGQEKVKHHA